MPTLGRVQTVRITEGLRNGSPVRTSDDGDTLERMTTSRIHERNKRVLARLLDPFTMHADSSITSTGAMTFRRGNLEKGLEPDNCYRITHDREMRHGWDADVTVHPPPDLCVEIEVSRSVVDRLAIDTALAVPEGRFVEQATSTEVPGCPVDSAATILDPTEEVDEGTRIRRCVGLLRHSE